MTINLETSIRWMSDRVGKVTYSMDYRNGPNSYDCSSAVYYALMAGGAISAGWAVNTEYMHDWLIRNGYTFLVLGLFYSVFAVFLLKTTVQCIIYY